MKTIANHRFAAMMLGALLLLCIPLIAMQFTSGVNWTSLDFAAAALLLFALGCTVELALRSLKGKNARRIGCALVLLVFLALWVELAVGI